MDVGMGVSALTLAVAAVAAWGALGWMEWSSHGSAKARQLSMGLLVVGGLGAASVAWEAGAAPPPGETLHLAAGQQALLPAAHGGALVVSGEVPAGHAGESHAGRYRLILADAESQQPLSHLSGELETHWETRRAGRKGTRQQAVQHLEERHTLPDSAQGRPLSVQVESESGDLTGTLEISAVPRLPSTGIILGAGALLGGLGTWTDRRQGWRTHLGVNLVMLTVYTAVLATGLTPHADPHVVLGALLAAPFFGLPVGYLIRFLSPS